MTTPDALIKQYVALRDKVKAEEDFLSEKLKPYKQAMQAIEGFLAITLREAGAESIKTEFGTVYTTRIMSAKVADREAFLTYVLEYGETDFLTSAVSKEAVKAYMEKNDGQFPPGIEVGYMQNVNVRRA